MDSLPYDPRAKQQVRDAIINFLYEPVLAKLQARIEEIIQKNTVLAFASHQSFIYKEVFYNNDPTPPPLGKNRLQPQLKPYMEQYLADRKKIYDEEMPYVVGHITKTLNQSNCIHDWLQMFPESVHRPLLNFVNVNQLNDPCKAKHMTDAQLSAFAQANAVGTQLLKNRLMLNLFV